MVVPIIQPQLAIFTGQCLADVGIIFCTLGDCQLPGLNQFLY